MAYTRYRLVDFGKSRGGLSTVGYTLTGGTRTTAGVAEIGVNTGIYGATITFTDGFSGSILWDSGEATPVYAAGAVNPGDDERTDTKVSTSVGSVTVAANGFDAVLDAAATIGGGTLRQALRAAAGAAAGKVVESTNADGSVTTTTVHEFLDDSNPILVGTVTDTLRTVVSSL